MTQETQGKEGTEKSAGEYTFYLDEKTPAPFDVGMMINLQIAAPKYKVNRFPVYLAGWISPHLLMTYHKHYDTGILAIPKDTAMIARYLFHGQIYGFLTKLYFKQSEPLNLWFLEYPNRIEVKNLRQSNRIPITLQVSIKDGAEFFTHDISVHGASLLVSADSPANEMKVGKELELDFSLPDGTPINALKAVIVRVYSEKSHQMLGVKFDESNMQLSLIAAYLEKIEKNFIEL